jgi:hypothetical protein
MKIVRRRRMRMYAAGAVGLFLLAGAVLCDGPEPPRVNRGLKILYVGHPGSEREKDFVQFLEQYFETVKTADLSAFDRKVFADEDMKSSDVTILDYDGDGFKAPRAMLVPRFLDDVSRRPRGSWLTRPVITVSVAGGLIASQAGLKTGYL